MSPNALNQYLGRRTADTGADLFVGYDYDADGNLTAMWVQGDMNCDGDLDFFDITPFNLAVEQGCAAYEAAYPNCDCRNADINGDGVIDADDIDPFSALLTGDNPARILT